LKLQGKMVIWPANLDSSKTRKAGRKIVKAAAIQAPRLEEISEAAKRLSMESELAPGKSRPGSWRERGGYAIFRKDGTKANTLRSLANEIKKARATKTGQERRT
jgi:signal recognition particle subunit SRP19